MATKESSSGGYPGCNSSFLRHARPGVPPPPPVSSTFGPKAARSDDDTAVEAANMVRSRRMSRFMRNRSLVASRGSTAGSEGKAGGGATLRTPSPRVRRRGPTPRIQLPNAQEGVLAATERTDALHRLPQGIRTALRTAWVHHYTSGGGDEGVPEGGSRTDPGLQALPPTPGVATGQHAAQAVDSRATRRNAAAARRRAEERVAAATLQVVTRSLMGGGVADPPSSPPAPRPDAPALQHARPTTSSSPHTASPSPLVVDTTRNSAAALPDAGAGGGGTPPPDVDADARREVLQRIKEASVAPRDLATSRQDIHGVPPSTVHHESTSRLVQSHSTLGSVPSLGGDEGGKAGGGAFTFDEEGVADSGPMPGQGGPTPRTRSAMLAAAAALLASPRPAAGGSRPPLSQGPSPLAMLQAGTPRDTSTAAAFNLQRFVTLHPLAEEKDGEAPATEAPTLKAMGAKRRRKGRRKQRVRMAPSVRSDTRSISARSATGTSSTSGVDLSMFRDASSLMATSQRAAALASSASRSTPSVA